MTTKTFSLTILGLILTLIFLVPSGSLFGDNVGFCLHKKILGFDCPGCGMTRAIHYFFHLNFLKATELNYAVFGFFPFLIITTAFQLTDWKILKKLRTVTFYIFISLLISVYISRVLDLIN